MNQYKKVAFYTLGCKLNFSETSTIGRLFEDAGFAKVDFDDRPDVYVINTCSVTENANKRCRSLVRKALKVNAEAFVIIVGCYAQLKPKELSEIPGVDMVLGANEKFNIISHLAGLDKLEATKVLNEEIKLTKEFIPSYSANDRTRSFLKIQDGCDYFCSFCTIPLARGTSRSNTVAKTIESAKEVAATEVKEVVLTGVNIGDFGKGTHESFHDLIKELDQIEGVERFRISSIEPNLLSQEIIEFVGQSKKFAPHFHVPLQSGSDVLLKSMRRRYDQALYTDRVNKIRKVMPDACIGVDVIVGYPGESDDLFLETYNYLKDLEISYLHVFTYSERDNTTAVRMEEVVPHDKRNERSKMLRILSEKKKRSFYEQHAGKTFQVLFEGENDGEYITGFTENYIKVKTIFEPHLKNQLVKVKLTELGIDSVYKTDTLIKA